MRFGAKKAIPGLLLAQVLLPIKNIGEIYLLRPCNEGHGDTDLEDRTGFHIPHISEDKKPLNPSCDHNGRSEKQQQRTTC